MGVCGGVAGSCGHRQDGAKGAATRVGGEWAGALFRVEVCSCVNGEAVLER